jgi:hypothetical protein
MKGMKHIILLVAMAALSSCGHPTHKTPMFLGLVGPMEWPEEHWEGQDYHPLIRDYQNALPAASNRTNSMFNDVAGLSPTEFVESLKSANIVNRVYNERVGVVERQDSGKVVIVLGENFYMLSHTDQNMIAELLAKSYKKDTYILKDGRTGRYVGQITPSGLNMF